MAVWRVPGLAAAWPAVAIGAATVSAVLLVLFWNWHLVFGLVIDAALVVLAIVQPRWLDQVMTRGVAA
ncbi:MAG TPA: hypothetical protein VHM65_01170 [Candidatus Lustribacter sp.]|nr:hypothetical protein [Candidatus Lustribacter sp.]